MIICERIFVLRKYVLAALAGCLPLVANAQSAGDFWLGAGVQRIMPADDNGRLSGNPVDLPDSTRGAIIGEYMLRDNLGIEILMTLPVELTASTASAGRVGRVDQTSFTALALYHFAPMGNLAPFAGAGINFSRFSDETGFGAFSGADLSVDDSWGAALVAGLDYNVTPRGKIRADLRWSDIDADVKLDGADVGTVKIDPLSVGLSYLMRF